MIGIIKGQRDLDFKIGTLGFKDCKIRILGFNGFLNNICLIYDMSVLQEAIFKNQYSLVLIITKI